MNRFLSKLKPPLLATLLMAVLFAYAVGARAQSGYTWTNVSIGGAYCWVTGIVDQPKVPGLIYIRTDVGGAYRRDPSGSRWIPITDRFTFDQVNGYGIESIAADPGDPDGVYIAAAPYTRNVGAGAIYRSQDRGATWTKLSLAVPMGSNEDRRWGGERLGIDPNDPRVLLFGSRTMGLWRSTDCGETWSVVKSIPVPSDIYGVLAVTFDPQSPDAVYAAVSGSGVYESTDSGASFTLMPGSPNDVRRLVIGGDRVLWATYGAGVARCARGAWQSVTPGPAQEYSAIAVDPANPDRVLAATGGHRASAIYRTENGGAAWSQVNAKISINVPWFTDTVFWGISTFLFDPLARNSVWCVYGLGILKADNIESDPVTFTQQESGHEEICITGLSCPPVGTELLAGALDVDGFAFTRGLHAYPLRPLGVFDGEKEGRFGLTTQIVYEENDPRNMVRVGGVENRGPGNMAVSTDGGGTWRRCSGLPANSMLVKAAMSATDSANIVATGGNQLLYTVDGGRAWAASQGAPALEANNIWYLPIPLTADGSDGGVFYFYHAGILYRSADKGANFAAMNGPSPLPPANTFQLRAAPGLSGDLWLSEENNKNYWQSLRRPAWEGLYHSVDGGATWTKLATISRAVAFGFGKAAPGRPSTLFVYGRIPGDASDHIYRSIDLGRTWIDIQDPKLPIGDNPWYVEGSRQTFGRVFVGTYGRGIYCGEAK